jgi:hypothetical protein
MVLEGSDSINLLLGIIAAFAVVAAAIIPLLLSKRNETQQRLKKSKLERYDSLLKTLTSFTESPNYVEAKNFVMEYNRASSYAKTNVLEACDEFLKAMETATIVRHERRKLTTSPILDIKKIEETVDENKDKINKIFKMIRKDINPKERDFDFKVYFGRET